MIKCILCSARKISGAIPIEQPRPLRFNSGLGDTPFPAREQVLWFLELFL